MALIIAPYQASHHAAVCQLILGIQQGEFGVPITLADQPDLNDIPAFYQAQGGFWVALDEGVVVGTIALLHYAPTEGALRKMFVAPSHRGRVHGVAQRLLDTLLGYARLQGITTITLGTLERFAAAILFYERNGFVPIAPEALPPAFPRMPVDTHFFQLQLG